MAEGSAGEDKRFLRRAIARHTRCDSADGGDGGDVGSGQATIPSMTTKQGA